MQADYLQIVLVLAFIVGLILLMSWGARRLVSVRPGDNSAIAIVATRFIGPREKLLLVDVEGTRVLVGITATSMSPIATLGPKKAGFPGELESALTASKQLATAGAAS